MRRGEQTLTLILNEAVALASQVGLEGLSIGSLTDRLAMFKSGLVAHFGSKEDLQLLTLKQAQALFFEEVFAPALKQTRGLPRLRALFSNWLQWVKRDLPGGCLILAASAEYDDRPGAVRDLLVAGEPELRGAIAQAIPLAIDQGQLQPDPHPLQLPFQLFRRL